MANPTVNESPSAAIESGGGIDDPAASTGAGAATSSANPAINTPTIPTRARMPEA